MADIDPIETQEWLEALEDVVTEEGPERAAFLLQQVLSKAKQQGVSVSDTTTTAYLNTVNWQGEYAGNLEIEERLNTIMRWNAMATVVRGGKRASELGGHIASYASASHLYEMGFNHFFHGQTDSREGDLVFIQGHSSPGIYARAYLEGRLTEENLDSFREEIDNEAGLSSYPHPWLMPDFWQFPTVSMGLGPIQAIYQARFLKYLENRGLISDKNKGRKVWVFCGDGEMDEPESVGALSIAAREKLDNLIFIINCNLQRLDGPVRGNGKIIQELEGIFTGANWKVLKVIWGKAWDDIFAKDKTGAFKQHVESMVDGQCQYFHGKPPSEAKEVMFGASAELQALGENLTDEDIENLRYGGNDSEQLHAAFTEAVNTEGKPVVILAKSVKGFGMGPIGQGQNTTHQQKKMPEQDLINFVKKNNLPLTDEQAAKATYYKPAEDSPEMQYLHAQRKNLGGYLPARRQRSASMSTPDLEVFKTHLQSSGEREISTTMAFVRILNTLLKDKNLKEHIVPIVPDESRTFGMEGMFRQIGIYSPEGQLYTPVDAGQLMYYREDTKGQILEEGLNEAGAFCSWMAAGSSYSVSDVPMIPFYIYYSMFGFQRIGDFAWAAGDMRCRGFLLGATAGRTTLAGEGLQHQDGHSHIQAGLIPNCITYDPTYGYELAVIIQDGLRRMYQEQEDVFYYITVMNENYVHPELPKGAEEGIIKGMYRLSQGNKGKHKIQLMGCGTILEEVRKAADILAQDYDVCADVWSVTSFNELTREASDCERHNRLNPKAKAKTAYVTACLADTDGPIIAATDYVRLYAEQIRAYVPREYTVLGTDGFGRSDTRQKLRHFFEVDAKQIVYASLKSLADAGSIDMKMVLAARDKLGIDADKANPVSV